MVWRPPIQRVLESIKRRGYLRLESSGRSTRKKRWRVICRDGTYSPWARVVYANKIWPKKIPKGWEVDHINEDCCDDHLENLIALPKDKHYAIARMRKAIKKGEYKLEPKKDGKGSKDTSRRNGGGSKE